MNKTCLGEVGAGVKEVAAVPPPEAFVTNFISPHYIFAQSVVVTTS